MVNTLAQILVLAIVILIVALAIYIACAHARGARVTAGAYSPAVRSKLEARVIREFEEILHAPLDQAHPQWLVENGVHMELDGYNERLRLAVEVQGPQHTRPLPTDSYAEYATRVARDERKKELCAHHGVTLIVIDYTIAASRYGLRNYILSRLYDSGHIKERPADYCPAVPPRAWYRGMP